MAYPDPVLLDLVRGDAVQGSEITLEVAESAIEHRVASLLLDAVSGPERMGPEVTARLTAYQLAVEARRRLGDRVMTMVHRRLDAEAITHTFLKGATSAKRWFDKPSHRPYNDIDVLVEKSDMRKAVAVLDDSHPILAIPEADFIRELSSVVLTIDGVAVDIQTDALRTGLTPNDSTGWAMGADVVVIDEELSFPALGTEHDLVMFLLHQGRDRFRYLLGVVEARRRLDGSVDWGAFEGIARREGIWEQVSVSLEVMCQELGRATPITIPSGWRTRLWRFLWRPKVRLMGEIGRFKHIRRARWLMPLTTRGRTFDAISWLWRSAFPADAILRLHHQSARGPYLWRAVASRTRIISRRRRFAWRNPLSKRGQ